MPTDPTLISALPTPPARSDPPDLFISRADAWVGAQPSFRAQINDLSTVNYNNAVEAEGAATTAINYAIKVDGFADGSDNSAKSWAIGGTGTGAPAAGDAKSWATKTGSAVASSEFSAKEHASGTSVTTGSAKDWAQKTSGVVITDAYSAKEWSVGTQIRGVAGAGSAKDWAIYTGGTVDGSNFSAKYHADSAISSASDANDGAVAAANSAAAAAASESNATAAEGGALAAETRANSVLDDVIYQVENAPNLVGNKIDYQAGRRKGPFGLTGVRMIRDDFTTHVGLNSCILDAGGGKWIFVYRESAGHAVTDGALIVAEDSYDQGVTRVNRRTIFTDPAYDTRNFVPFHGANGRIGVIAIRRTLTGGDSYGAGVFIYSDDGGAAWLTIDIVKPVGLNGFNFNGAVLPWPAALGGHDTEGFMTLSYEGNRSDVVRTPDNGATWDVVANVLPVDARFTAMSESVQWCVAPSKYVVISRCADADGLPIHYCAHISTDFETFTGPFDSGLVMNTVDTTGNPPGQINEPDANGTIHLIGFSRGGREIIAGLRDWMLSASIDGEALFAANGDFSALGVDWQPIMPLPSWTAASLQTTKIDGKWFGTLNVGEDYWTHGTSGLAMIGDFVSSTADDIRMARAIDRKNIPLVLRAHRNGANLTVPSATATDIPFPSLSINTGFGYNPTTGEITFPESGYYEVETVLRFTAGVVAGQNNISYIRHISTTGSQSDECFDVVVSGYTSATLRSRATALFLKGEKTKISVSLAGAGDKTLNGSEDTAYLIVKKI